MPHVSKWLVPLGYSYLLQLPAGSLKRADTDLWTAIYMIMNPEKGCFTCLRNDYSNTSIQQQDYDQRVASFQSSMNSMYSNSHFYMRFYFSHDRALHSPNSQKPSTHISRAQNIGEKFNSLNNRVKSNNLMCSVRQLCCRSIVLWKWNKWRCRL